MTGRWALPRRRVLGAVLGVVLGVVLAGCAGYSGTPRQQVQEWASANSYKANERQVVSDADRLERAQRQGTVLQLRTVGEGLSSDTGTLYQTLPTPDQELTSELNRASQNFFHAGETCADAPSTHTARVVRAMAEVRSGLKELAAARQRFAHFGVSS